MVEVSIRGAGRVRAGSVYCLGRNYQEHAREMGASPEPVVFLKPTSALLPAGGDVPWPRGSQLVHHEVELVLVLGAGGTDLDPVQAEEAITGIGVGIDLTARDIQAEAKEKGHPWTRSKGFPGSAPVSEFVDFRRAGMPWVAFDFELAVEDEIRQRGSAGMMQLPPPQIVAGLSRFFALEPGDVIFTGTPEGVGPVQPGETLFARSAALRAEVSVRMLQPRD